MSAVNAELRPFVKMTHPRDCERLTADNTSVRAGFSSWVLLLGFIPIDRHRFWFDEIVDGARFSERSHSWLNRSWQHRREVTEHDVADASIVSDELIIEPRFVFLAPLMRFGVAFVFRHRHRRLQQTFGVAP